MQSKEAHFDREFNSLAKFNFDGQLIDNFKHKLKFHISKFKKKLG